MRKEMKRNYYKILKRNCPECGKVADSACYGGVGKKKENMKLESQVVSLELAKKLKELGVEQESLWYWKSRSYNNVVRSILVEGIPKLKDRVGYYSAFTVAELGEMLPKNRVSKHSETGNWVCGVQPENSNGFLNYAVEKTEADARAKMLIYLLENKLINL